MSPEANDAGRGIRDQISRYSSAFAAVVGMVLLAALVGGYILSQERLSLPGWVPIFGRSHFMLKAEFQSGDALTPGQGQAVTIAGAKVGEIGAVETRNGVAVVTMEITPKYARDIYRDSTLIMRPRTQLKDETIQITPGLQKTGKVRSGYTFSLSQTTPDGDFDQFLAALDAETRTYLQELLNNAGVALHENGRALAADFTRFDPITRDLQKINSELHLRHVNIERAIHNFQLLLNAIGGKDKQLTEVLQASNQVFTVFSRQQAAVEETLRTLPGTLQKTNHGLSALARAANVVAPTLTKLHGFATSYGPSQEALRQLAKNTTPVIKNEIAPFTREVLPVLQQVTPATKAFNNSLPKLASSFKVIEEIFNELGYNPGPKKAGFLFFADWASHDFNSALSTSDADGPMGRALLYYNCFLSQAIAGAAEINPTVKVIDNLLKPPSQQQCEAEIKEKVKGVTASVPKAHSSVARSASAKRGGR
ncbi:MAG TPA: MlaD family protein [Solirubrobacteraceae bacterium]|jgi:phospholipid/cholesterol/gamma-HCH transport system substrate-binding protein|nr:MlaD family protein [Solirubrobacteraceae bacterium]